MKFGVFDHMDASGGTLDRQFRDRLALVETYDRVGLYAYHLAEHHATPLGLAPSPGVFLSAVAQHTRRLLFGPLVYLLPLYHPLRLLEEICMLDHLSGGRFQLGVGRGVSPIELGFFGVDVPASHTLYRESLDILRRGFASDRLDFDGRHYRFSDVPITLHPLQRPHPPFWYGTSNLDSIPWIAGEGFNVVTLGTTDHVRRMTDAYRTAWTRAGRDLSDIPLMGVSRHLVVAETDADARAIARRAYPRWRESFVHLWRTRGTAVPRVNHVYPPTFDELMEIDNGFAGSPSAVRDWVARQVAGGRMNYLVSWLAFGDITVDEARRSAELLASEVVPAFSGRPDLATA